MLNAQSALAWFSENGVGDPYGRVIAVTASPEKAIEFGIDETRILPFAETVGGRYSLWSAIGFPGVVGLGWGGVGRAAGGAGRVGSPFRLGRVCTRLNSTSLLCCPM